jgi:chemosensory pili system protein ChpA (sensor histidine kinase/response regulator)
LSDWNEIKQVHQEFAEQGFDLVILDLEMALAIMPTHGEVPTRTIEIARSTIAQLAQIGAELNLAPGWMLLIDRGNRLISNPQLQLWRAIWMPYFEALKTCVKHSGEISVVQIELLDALETAAQITAPSAIDLSARSHQSELANVDNSAPKIPEDLLDLLDDFLIEEEIASVGELSLDSIDPLAEISTSAIQSPSPAIDLDEDLPDLLDDLFLDEEILPAAELPAEAMAAVTIEDRSIITSKFRSIGIDAAEELPDLLDDFFLDDRDEIDNDFSDLAELDDS